MADRSYLGEFELMLLLVVIRLGEEAYGVPVAHEIEQYRGRIVSVGSVYAALERLEAKGLITSSLGAIPRRNAVVKQSDIFASPKRDCAKCTIRAAC